MIRPTPHFSRQQLERAALIAYHTARRDWIVVAWLRAQS